MQEVLLQNHLDANLAALGERNGDLAARLRQMPPAADIVFRETPQGRPAATYAGRRLCSAHRPLDEARRLVDEIDIVEHAVVVVLGFGLGYHVQRLAERLDRTGVIVVFEPDLSLLRVVLERVDHSAWLKDALLVVISDPEDRGALSSALQGSESILAQGVEVLEHPASRERLGTQAGRFSSVLGEVVKTARTTLATTLVRSAETVANELGNIDHYVRGPGIAELAGCAAGAPAVIVSAGPSLRRNIDQLAAPGVRDRCVIVAVQTTLKPLLEAGVRPHFVTALDYHEISRRFYESLTPADVEGVTLVADPKAHPVILDAFPGPVRCCRSVFLDRVLGDLARPMGDLPAGATVAHLALYLARHLGCDPIALIGQDLGFSDGLYYAPGTAIDAVWAPELNPFNTIEMMQWQRIVRHRSHLHRTVDTHGRSIYTDEQMLTYLHQFERDFAAYAQAGVTIIDATEGGVAKQHVDRATLAEVLDRHATGATPPLPAPPPLDDARAAAARRRVTALRRDVAAVRTASRGTTTLLEKMIDAAGDQAAMQKHFDRMARHRAEVERCFEAFELLSHFNQLGVYKRQRADRRIHLTGDDPLARQRAQLDRDLENVVWIADAADDLIERLAEADTLLSGQPPRQRKRDAIRAARATDGPVTSTASRIAALVPVDPERNGLGVRRDLHATFAGRPVLQATLERLGRCTTIESIVLLVPGDFDVEPLIDRTRIRRPVEIEPIDGSPFPPEQVAIAAARAWAPTCWRGGIAGMSVYDETLCPAVMSATCARRGLTAALLVAPDWPLFDAALGDAIVRRHLEHPDKHSLVLTQAPPGLAGCVLSATLLRELTNRNRLATVGGLLVYQPQAPQGDPIARDCTVQIDHAIRDVMVRSTFDDPRSRRRLEAALAANADLLERDAAGVAAALAATGAVDDPPHVVLELTTRRVATGAYRVVDAVPGERPDLDVATAAAIFAGMDETMTLTLGGAGDPMLHEHFETILDAAATAGLRHVHVRTELRCPPDRLTRLLAAPVEIVSVDLHADRAEVYKRMMGGGDFADVLRNMEQLLAVRGDAALALPWIVPHLQRCSITAGDLETFFDRWQVKLGTCVIEGRPPVDDDPLSPAVTPPAAAARLRRTHRVILSDGTEVTA